MDLSILNSNKIELFRIIKEISSISSYEPDKVAKILINSKLANYGPATKNKIKQAYLHFAASKQLNLNVKQTTNFLKNIKLKNVRTASGVTPVTVMTMPYPCPGKCIYCPNEINVPKSYISNEPGAQRAIANHFDPYLQTFNRLVAYKNTGHPTDKVELIIIGGTWSYYPKNYQIWFIKRCLEAMNDFNISSNFQTVTNLKGTANQSYSCLKKVMSINETSRSRCVGMSVETRPDYLSKNGLIHLRNIGVTKVQLGVQSLDNTILKKVHRGHLVKNTIKAFKLLRQFGFKIQVHWMPNLLGATPKKDLKDYKKLCTNSDFIPDEIKIYPCSLIEGTELMKFYLNKKWKPYSYNELKNLIKRCLLITPRYCRISRIIRDISSKDIFIGNKKSNLRQNAEDDIRKSSELVVEIRVREIRNDMFEGKELIYKETEYKTSSSKEIFMEMVDGKDRIAGFLRLSFPTLNCPIKELEASAIVREIHIYGQSLAIGQVALGAAQHTGIGKLLIGKAIKLASDNKFEKLSVISSVGTKEYYRKLGFSDGVLYQHFPLKHSIN
jgi:elongator complex protein 3